MTVSGSTGQRFHLFGKLRCGCWGTLKGETDSLWKNRGEKSDQKLYTCCAVLWSKLPLLPLYILRDKLIKPIIVGWKYTHYFKIPKSPLPGSWSTLAHTSFAPKYPNIWCTRGRLRRVKPASWVLTDCWWEPNILQTFPKNFLSAHNFTKLPTSTGA